MLILHAEVQSHDQDYDARYTQNEWSDRFYYDRDMQQQRHMQSPDHAQPYRRDGHNAPERLGGTYSNSGDITCELRLYVFVVVIEFLWACLLCFPCLA